MSATGSALRNRSDCASESSRAIILGDDAVLK
jgi:hypothetical protein